MTNQELEAANTELRQQLEQLVARTEVRLTRLTAELERQTRVYESILASVRDYLYVLDREGRVVYANPPLLDLWALALDQVRGRTLRELDLPEEVAATLLDGARQVTSTGATVRSVTWYTGPNGVGGWYENLQAPVRGQDGRIELVAVSSRDVTERRRAAEALRAANEQLQEADRRKDEFLAVLSHELRNPLAPIRNSLFILDRLGVPGEPARQALAVIGRQVDQLSRLVNDLLDVTRVTRGKISLHREPLELGELVRRTVEDHRSVFGEAAVRVVLEVAPMPLPVEGDASRLAQVVGNLLQNAAKFTPSGGCVRVSLTAEPPASRVVLKVADNGLGMASETLARLFQPFQQADSTIDRSRGGLGLGLALAKGLVELHGGEINATSAGLGRGAEFTVLLPLSAGAATDAAPTVPARPAVARRVVVVDDNVDSADTLRDALRVWGHEVATAHDGYEALVQARTFQPDVLLCDIGLPGMDGYGVARAMRADPGLRRITLVALSGYASPEDISRAREAGFDHHLAKPADLERLARLLAASPSAEPD
ncbi:MAG TPA: ATP-binding protein [Vicinamibacteria bacterium]|nr:ATP-binding protein [Vicinamibacteria bacterium]